MVIVFNYVCIFFLNWKCFIIQLMCWLCVWLFVMCCLLCFVFQHMLYIRLLCWLSFHVLLILNNVLFRFVRLFDCVLLLKYDVWAISRYCVLVWGECFALSLPLQKGFLRFIILQHRSLLYDMFRPLSSILDPVRVFLSEWKLQQLALRLIIFLFGAVFAVDTSARVFFSTWSISRGYFPIYPSPGRSLQSLFHE